MALTKSSVWQSLYGITNVASNTTSTGSALDVSTYYSGGVHVLFGRLSGTALSVQPQIRLQYTGVASSPTAQDWATTATWKPAVGSSVFATTISSGGGSGSTAVTVGSTTNLAAQDYVFIQDSTLANSEWVRVVSVSGSVMNIAEALINTHANGSNLFDQSEEYSLDQMDLTSVQKLRLQVENAGTGQGIVVLGRFCGATGL